jgi:hypothetical protein
MLAKALGVVVIQPSRTAFRFVPAVESELYAPAALIAGTAIDTDLLATATTPVGVLIASLNSIDIVSYL